MALNPRLFSDHSGAKVFGLPPGVDFSTELVSGLDNRLVGEPPEALGRVELIVNTTRMRRRLRSLYATRGPGFLPRIKLLTEVGAHPFGASSSKLTRRLELAQLVRALLQREQSLAPRSAVFDLAQSLERLLDEIEGEGVSMSAIENIDVGQLSDHWSRSLQFIRIIAPYIAGESAAGREGEHRTRVLRLIAHWADQPPCHPVIVAGSTGSRGTTALLMQAIAKLPNGAVVLPGFDFHQPATVWNKMGDALGAEDHPQFRAKALLEKLGGNPTSLPSWTDALPPSSSRNKLISLALRPAPVTDQWLTDGPLLSDLPKACSGMSLVEAPTPRLEAQAIALCLRNAAADGKQAALVTPDRVLARQVTAALDRWRIKPDDSAGRPLSLTPPGRFLRQVGELLGERPRADTLIALLKHPLTHSFDPGTRGFHLLLTRELELELRKRRKAEPDPSYLRIWADARPEPQASAWGEWLSATLDAVQNVSEGSLSQLEQVHRKLAEGLACGTGSAGAGGLWDLAAGTEALRLFDQLRDAAPHGGAVTLSEYRALIENLMADAQVREPVRAHPDVMIWGTLEARVQTADLVVLAGLNEGVWPPAPATDPWMNRVMRAQAGLLLPERQIGLSAHDFQQAVCAKEVVLTRSVRGDEAETVPSRWLNRLTNLLAGLSSESRACLASMRERGGDLLRQASRLDLPEHRIPSARRPAPRPPIAHRPKELPVTAVETLVRDPYAVYASRILRLRPMPLLGQEPDARDRGSFFHRVMEDFVSGASAGTHRLDKENLGAVARRILSQADYPADVSAFWRAHLDRIADDLIARETPRLADAQVILTEKRGTRITDGGFKLTCRADRFDVGKDGKLRIFDYKSTPPSKGQIGVFDFQLLLEAAIVESGGVNELGPQEIAMLAYISLSASARDVEIELDPAEPSQIWESFNALVSHWETLEAGYTARRMMKNSDDPSDYDHLSRHGEWDITDPAQPEEFT